MKKFTLLMSLVMICAAAMAQMTNSTLTVFSEDGHKFFLILNGQRMNDKPETNLRLQGLTQQYYNAKVIFDDKSYGEIDKKYLPVADVDNPNQSLDVVYKIKADKNGKQVLRFFSQQPVVVTATPVIPSDVVVYNYGTHVPVVNTTVTETTTTTTGGTGTGVGINMGGMGVNMNVHIDDPAFATQQTTTTTTYTTTTTSSSTPPPPPPAQQIEGPCAHPMTNPDYQSAKTSINSISFDDTKLKTAKNVVASNCLYANQIADICRLFSFDANKLDFAKYAYAYCYDQKNYFKVTEVFQFDSSKEELMRYTQR